MNHITFSLCSSPSLSPWRALSLAAARYFIFSTDSCALLPFIATVVREAHWTVRDIPRNGSLDYVGFQLRNASSTDREYKKPTYNKFECYLCQFGTSSFVDEYIPNRTQFVKVASNDGHRPNYIWLFLSWPQNMNKTSQLSLSDNKFSTRTKTKLCSERSAATLPLTIPPQPLKTSPEVATDVSRSFKLSLDAEIGVEQRLR